jgi:hypothetical protein
LLFLIPSTIYSFANVISPDRFEVLCETTNLKILFIVVRLFEDGNLYIITAYWAGEQLVQSIIKKVRCLGMNKKPRLADENGLSKSAFIRMVVKKALKEHEVH